MLLVAPAELTFEGSQLKLERVADPQVRKNMQSWLGERRLYLSGIPISVTAQDIWDTVSRVGQIKWITKLRRCHPPLIPPRFYCYVTMDRREDADLLASKPFMRVSDGSSIRVQHFIARSERKSGKEEEMSQSFEGSERASDSRNVQPLAVEIGLDHRNDSTSPNENRINMTTTSKRSNVVQDGNKVRNSIPSQISQSRTVGFRHVTGQSLGITGWTEFANNRHLKIRQSLSISMIPRAHDNLCAAGLRFNVKNQ